MTEKLKEITDMLEKGVETYFTSDRYKELLHHFQIVRLLFSLVMDRH